MTTVPRADSAAECNAHSEAAQLPRGVTATMADSALRMVLPFRRFGWQVWMECVVLSLALTTATMFFLAIIGQTGLLLITLISPAIGVLLSALIDSSLIYYRHSRPVLELSGETLHCHDLLFGRRFNRRSIPTVEIKRIEIRRTYSALSEFGAFRHFANQQQPPSSTSGDSRNAAPPPMSNLGNIVIRLKSKREIIAARAYPLQWIRPIARFAAAVLPKSVPVMDRSEVKAVRAPASSGLDQEGPLTVALPSAPATEHHWRRLSIMNGFATLVTMAMAVGAGAGAVSQWGTPFGPSLASFCALSSLLAAAYLHGLFAVRWQAGATHSLHADSHGILVESNRPLFHHRSTHVWPAGDIADVRIGFGGWDDPPLKCLDIMLHDGRTVGLFPGQDEQLLLDIAARSRAALGLPE